MSAGTKEVFSFTQRFISHTFWIVIFHCFFLLYCIAYGQDGYLSGRPEIAYWKVAGGGPGIVIALHGGPCAGHSYLRPELDLLNKNSTIVFYDQRGCGLSQADTSYSWQEHVKDLKRLKEKVSPKNKVSLVGSSWGSTLAMIYAYLYPDDVKSIILTGTYKWEGKGIAYKAKPWASSALTTRNIETRQIHENSIIRAKTAKGGDENVLLDIYKDIEIGWGPANVDTRRSFISAPVFDSLRKITIPVLIFNGSRKCNIDRARDYLKIFPNATLHTIEGACHDPWLSDPKQFATVCNKFLLMNR